MKTIVKIPKKLRDIFSLIRNGEIEIGIDKLNALEDFTAQKGVALAEVYYYQSNYNLAMTFDENSLLYNNAWYAGNILDEHFFAYTYAAIQSNQIERAIKFYNFFFEVKEQLNLPEYLINEYRYKVEQHILKLKGFNELKIFKDG
ncbi:hypothetical protein [Chryseobacterium gossypii]|uniref:hypothetical protein n=1 Tax=Chryseobacterium gossypii TaxID=3231602 RepID=UPI00352496B8